MANITITIPDKQVNRVRSAFAYALGLGSPPAVSLTDVKTYIVTDLKQFVQNAEKRRVREQTAVGSPQFISFT